MKKKARFWLICLSLLSICICCSACGKPSLAKQFIKNKTDADLVQILQNFDLARFDQGLLAFTGGGELSSSGILNYFLHGNDLAQYKVQDTDYYAVPVQAITDFANRCFAGIQFDPLKVHYAKYVDGSLQLYEWAHYANTDTLKYKITITGKKVLDNDTVLLTANYFAQDAAQKEELMQTAELELKTSQDGYQYVSSTSKRDFMQDNDGYTTRVEDLDIIFLPLFADAATLTDKDKYRYFCYFVYESGLADQGEDWYDAQDKVYRIPLTQIKRVLKTYFGTDAFDPVTAFGKGLKTVSYANVPIGYDEQKQMYICPVFTGWGGVRDARLLGKEKIDANTVRVTIGFYDEQGALYKKTIATMKEDPADRKDYQLLSVIEVWPIGGKEYTITTQEDYEQIDALLDAQKEKQ